MRIEGRHHGTQWMKTYDFIRLYVERRRRHWLIRRAG
jgi:hypothetical protein